MYKVIDEVIDNFIEKTNLFKLRENTIVNKNNNIN